jgi:DNA-binding NarL/FixJ family response regulator
MALRSKAGAALLEVEPEVEDEVLADGTIRVAVVDDHAMVAEGLARIISDERDFKLVGIATNVAEALTLFDAESPDVVLMDYRLPDGDGAEAAKKILKRSPKTKVVMVSAFGGDGLLARAIESGCSGMLAKEQPAEDVVDAVRSASRGESVMRSSDLAGLLERLRGRPKTQARFLSVRELEVLRLLAKGHSTTVIAHELYLSTNTVRNHVGNILSKLGVHSKLEAVALAARDGIVSLNEIG